MIRKEWRLRAEYFNKRYTLYIFDEGELTYKSKKYYNPNVKLPDEELKLFNINIFNRNN